jgi:hypothetical protein
MEQAVITFALFTKPIAGANVESARKTQDARHSWGCMMVGRAYLSRQMMALLNFARATDNPELAALLVQKAARLKSQADEIAPPQDIGPRAPDVEPIPRTETSRTD